MFNLSTQEVVSSIEKTPLVNLDGTYFQKYQDFFGKEFTLPALENKNFENLEGHEDWSRARLDYNDDLAKKIKIFLMNSTITHALGSKFKTSLKFESVDIWLDGKGYRLAPHTDHSNIKLSLQIYLSDDNKGTSLYDDEGNIRHTFPFNFNSGYALYNNVHSRHGLEELEKDGRISLYARYS
jgi:hypothetical protein